MGRHSLLAKTQLSADQPVCTFAGLSLVSLLVATSLHTGNLRIIGGCTTELDQYPSIAGLVNNGAEATEVFCGASLIAPQWIITAAHCLQGETDTGAHVLLTWPLTKGLLNT